MGIFRLFRGELKKIFLGIGIFIMSGLLILVLAIAPQFFNPSEKSDISSSIIVGATVGERFYNYEEKYLTSSGADYIYTKMLNNAQDIEDLLNTATSPKETVSSSFIVMQASREAFSGAISVQDIDDSALPEIKDLVQTFYNNLDSLKSTFLLYVQKNIPQILTTKDNQADIMFAINNLMTKLELNLNKNTIADFKQLDTDIRENKYINIIQTGLQKLKDLPFDKPALQKLYDKYYTEALATLNLLYNQAKEVSLNNASSSDGETIVKLDGYLNKHLSISNNCENILKYGALNIISKQISDSELSKYDNDLFVDFNSYQIQEALTKYVFLFDNQKADSDFANVFAFNYNSNTKTTAYDYMYFVMEIMSFLIIAYCVILAANMIAGEQSSGTMKMLAIRPYKRYKIMFAKILATMFFAFIFMLVTTIVSLITGIIMYDLNSLPILAVFNAQYAFTIEAPLMYLIYFATVFIKVWIFVMIAFAISTIFKNGILATIISIMLYFVTLILTFVSSGASWIKYVITANLDLFKYFGGSFIINGSTDALTNLFRSPVFSDTNILFGGIIVGALFVVLHFITYLFFTKKDIN